MRNLTNISTMHNIGLLERIYQHSPLFFQNIMTSISGYQRCQTRYGKEYWEYRNFLMDFDTWPSQQQFEYQMKTLKGFLLYAVSNSIYYKKSYQGIDINSIKSIEDLKSLPILEKDMLRRNIGDIITIPKKGSVEGRTGGTTGKSLLVLSTVEDNMRRMAMLDHFKSRVGFEHRKMKRASFNGKHIIPQGQKNPVFWRYNASCKQMIFSSLHVKDDNIPYYIQKLEQFQPQSLDGYPSSIIEIANYIQRKGIIHTIKPDAIFTTSETLTSSGRELMESVFQCKVYNQYASGEGAPFVTECPHQSLHVELASGVFEQMEDSDEVLVTSFTTHGTPLIRYRIGDCFKFADKDFSCGCKSSSPVISSIEGRQMDNLMTPEGLKFNVVHAANLLKTVGNVIIRAQFVQELPYRLTLFLVVDKVLFRKKHEQILLQELKYHFGEKMYTLIKYVDDIQRETNGKYCLIKNKLGSAL